MSNIFTKLGSALQRAWSFFYNREWAGLLGFITFLLANAESIAELVSGEIEKAGSEFDARTLLIIVATLAIRWNVYSRATVAERELDKFDRGVVVGKTLESGKSISDVTR